MKKIFLFLLAVTAMMLQSCQIEDKKLFCETPAERVEAYLNEYRELLVTPEEGWLLEYFPEETQAYGGYAYVLKFTKEEVSAWFQLADDVTVPVTSMYKLTQDDGPVLTFDTYNENLHYFATPSVSDYEAMHGDYEFRIMGASDDKSEVYLRGKRTDNKYVLKAFSGDPGEYLAKVVEISEGMAAPAYAVTIDGKEAVSGNITGNYFTYTLVTAEATETTDAVTEDGAMAFCYTDTGANFYEPITINGVTYDKLVYDAANGTLATEDGKVVINQIIPPLNQLFVLGNWFIKYSALSPEGQFYFDYVKKNLTAIGEELQFAFLGSMLYPGAGFGFQFISSGYGGALSFNYQLEGEDIISLQFAMAGAGDGVWYHNNAGFHYALRPFGYSSARTFQLTADDNKNPTQVTMTEVGNPAHTMTLFAAQIMYPFDN